MLDPERCTLTKMFGSMESRAKAAVRSTLSALVRPEQTVRSPRSVMTPRAFAIRGRPSQCSSIGTMVAPSASWTNSARSRSSISSVFKMKGIAMNATAKIDSGYRVR